MMPLEQDVPEISNPPPQASPYLGTTRLLSITLHVYVCMYVFMYVCTQDLLLNSTCEKGRGNREINAWRCFQSMRLHVSVIRKSSFEIRPGTRHVDSLQAVGSYGALRRAAKLVVVGFCWLRIYKCSLELLQSRSCRLWCGCLFGCFCYLWSPLLSLLLFSLYLVVVGSRKRFDFGGLLLLLSLYPRVFLVAYIAACIFCGVFKSRTLRRRRATSRTCGQRRSDLWRKWDGFGLLFSAPTH
jgi:hypothetical protein